MDDRYDRYGSARDRLPGIVVNGAILGVISMFFRGLTSVLPSAARWGDFLDENRRIMRNIMDQDTRKRGYARIGIANGVLAIFPKRSFNGALRYFAVVCFIFDR